MKVKQVKIGPFLVNVCIKCGEPVTKAQELTYGSLPSARIECRDCIKAISDEVTFLYAKNRHIGG